jgi:hypothetical protein
VHLCNYSIETLLRKYHISNRTFTGYHPLKNGQAEVFNREIKSIIEKNVQPNKKDWAYRIAYKTLIRMSPFKMI